MLAAPAREPVTHFESSLPLVLQSLEKPQLEYLTSIFQEYNGFPSVEQLWSLMDNEWNAYDCDPLTLDSRISAFYSHPVWLLNGLFVECDQTSLSHRRVFAEWVCSKNPERIADFGGGFGSLARTIGELLPSSIVEVIEPHPHPSAVALAKTINNVRYVPQMSGHYDLIIATDVFEHISDPLQTVLDTLQYLRVGGSYLMANCFFPVISCHLPQHYHFALGWNRAMLALGLRPVDKVQYGYSYKVVNTADMHSARRVESLSRNVYSFVRLLPKLRTRVGRLLLHVACNF